MDLYPPIDKEIPPRMRRREVIRSGVVALDGNTSAYAEKSSLV